MRNFSLFLLLMFLMACGNGDAGMETLGHGATLYKKHCANCHQADGSGLANLIPPLKESDYLQQNSALLPCIIQNGLKGKIMVNGKDYQLLMPPALKMTPRELEDLSVFVWQKFMKQPPGAELQASWLKADSCNF